VGRDVLPQLGQPAPQHPVHADRGHDLPRLAELGRVEQERPVLPRLVPAAEVISSYHSLWQVEASFRMTKSDLRARPVFHHQREAIEAHPTVVMTALAIARFLQDATGLSIKKIVQALRPIQQITVNIAGHEHTATDPLSDAARDILTATGVDWPTH